MIQRIVTTTCTAIRGSLPVGTRLSDGRYLDLLLPPSTSEPRQTEARGMIYGDEAQGDVEERVGDARPRRRGMTKAERTDLSRLIRRREALMKRMADERGKVLLAEFERQCATIHSWDDDVTWKAAHAAADEAVREAEAQVTRRCRDLGIPPEFAPSLRLEWYGRGENAAKERRSELRRVAEAQIDARVAHAKVAIEQQSVQLQTEIVAGGLASATAKAFLERMPTVEAMLPPLTVPEIRALLPGAGDHEDTE